MLSSPKSHNSAKMTEVSQVEKATSRTGCTSRKLSSFFDASRHSDYSYATSAAREEARTSCSLSSFPSTSSTSASLSHLHLTPSRPHGSTPLNSTPYSIPAQLSSPNNIRLLGQSERAMAAANPLTTTRGAPVFPLSSAELSSWAKFASEGGIGAALAVRDEEAEDATRDLMFLEGDEIVVLQKLAGNPERYLVSSRRSCRRPETSSLPSRRDPARKLLAASLQRQ